MADEDISMKSDISMSELTGMNRITGSYEGITEIRNAPRIPIESYSIFHGSNLPCRNYDIPTTQNLSNGVTLYYTPAEERSTSRTRGSSLKRKTARAATASSYSPPSKRRRIGSRFPAPGHRGLGALDQLPVSPQVIFSHGGVRGIQSSAFIEFVSGIARHFAVLCFQKDAADTKDDVDKRTAAFRYFFHDAYGSVVQWADGAEGLDVLQGRNLILWSYPLARDMDVRKEELLALPADARVLFIKGTQDWMGPEIVLRPVREQMKAKTWQIYVQDMDHNFNCKTELQEQKLCNALGVIAGLWLRGDDSGCPWNPEDGTEMLLAWDKQTQEVVWTEWQPKGDKPPAFDADALARDVASPMKASFNL